MKNLTDLLGKTLISAEQVGEDEILLTSDNGDKVRLYHQQNCCEHVYIEDLVGDLSDLTGSPITLAEGVSSHDGPLNEYEESYTWTFYKFATAKGYVDIRWYGSSNGYYSESVDIAFYDAEADRWYD